MILREKYILIKHDKPEVKNNIVYNDPNVGGEKLVYSMIQTKHKQIKLFGKEVINPIPFNYKKKQVYILRPFKSYWDKDRNRVARNYWGKKSHPLTYMWFTLVTDYKNLDKIMFPILDKQIKNHKLIKHLKKGEETFVLISNI